MKVQHKSEVFTSAKIIRLHREVQYFAVGLMGVYKLGFTIGAVALAIAFAVPLCHGQALMPMNLRKERVVEAVLVRSDSTGRFQSWRRSHGSRIQVDSVGDRLYRLSGLTERDWAAVQKAPGIQFIDRATRKAKEETLLGEFDFTANHVTAARHAYPTSNGVGLVLSVKEKPFDRDDLDVRGRVLTSNQFDEPSTPHATFMATLAAGAGNTTPFAQGAAWGASITTSDFDRLLPDPDADLVQQGVDVQNHSYGVGLENYYGLETQDYDRQGIALPKLLHIFSSGNLGTATSTDGPYRQIPGFANLTGQFKVSKNTLTVGSMDRFGAVVPQSSRGPAYDGRVKPELVAFGDAGSSESAAVVSGVALAVQQMVVAQSGTQPDAALVKALLINSARDVGAPAVDFATGFGSVDALAALRQAEQMQFFTGSVPPGQQQVFSVTVPANALNFKATLVWADPPAAPLNTRALVHDLDLVVDDGTNAWLPWVLDPTPSLGALQQPAVRGEDHLNNVEQVSLPNPVPGVYQMIVKGTATAAAQTFFLVYSWGDAFEWRFPLGGDGLRAGQTQLLRWSWNDAPEDGEVAFRIGSGNWEILEANYPLAQGFYEWLAPDTSAAVQFRIQTASSTWLSEIATLSRPERIKIGFVCEDNIMVFWPPAPGATEYQLFKLGEKYLEPFLTTADTFAVISKTALSGLFLSQAPRFSSGLGLREATVNYENQGVGCYFISVIPREPYTRSSAELMVTLGTTFNLKRAVLERVTDEGFTTRSSLSPLNSTSFSLTDSDPLRGSQRYRVRLFTLTDQEVLSAEEEIFFVDENDFYLFPNPVSAGQEVSIIIQNDEPAKLEILDLLGRVVFTTADFGDVKNMDTTGLGIGLFLVRVTDASGRLYLSRLVIK